MKEHKIGEEITVFDGKRTLKLKVTENTEKPQCFGCIFEPDAVTCSVLCLRGEIGKCFRNERSDRKNIIYKEVDIKSQIEEAKEHLASMKPCPFDDSDDPDDVGMCVDSDGDCCHRKGYCNYLGLEEKDREVRACLRIIYGTMGGKI